MPLLKRATRHIQARGIDLQVIRGCYGPYLYDPTFRKQTGKVYTSVECAINAAIAGERPICKDDPTPPACPFCPDTHMPGKCPVAAAMTGMPLIAELRAQAAELEIRRAATMAAAEGMADALVAYFNKRGSRRCERKGNEDIAAMADALANWGYALNDPLRAVLFADPPDIPDEGPNPTPGGPTPPEWRA